MTCTVCREDLAPALEEQGETTHPACVSDLGRGERHLEAVTSNRHLHAFTWAGGRYACPCGVWCYDLPPIP